MAETLNLNPRQRKFAELFATGMPAGHAYEQAGYASKGKAAAICASKLLANPNLAQHAKKLRDEAAAAAEAGTILTILEKRQFLARVVRTPIGDVAPGSDLCQEYATTPDGMRLKMPSKLEAIKLDSLLAGELQDAKRDSVNVSVSVVVTTDKLREIQDRRKAALGGVHGRN